MKYFDYAATTPPHPDVIRTMAEIMETQFGNPSSIHGYGERADQLLRRARSGCAAAIGVKPEEIVFTSGATESNNLAIKGAALRYQSRGRHIITTATEHASVYESVMQLQQWGWEVTISSCEFRWSGQRSAGCRRDQARHGACKSDACKQ